MKWVENAVGRMVPTEMNGRTLRPFQGAFADQGGGQMHGPPIPAGPRHIDKVVPTLDDAIDACHIQDGMTVGFHHHLRNGDYLINMVMERLAQRGLKDLVIAPSALFPVHQPLVGLIERGVLNRVEGSMNGPVGQACSLGKMQGTAVLRSHGGRFRAIQDGDLKIDVAFIAAPTADAFGNANGVDGPSACGPLGFALADSLYADKVVVVTDNLVPFPCVPWSIQGGHVDLVTTVDSLGDNTQIISGTTQITRSPTQLLIARYALEFMERAGVIRQGFSFQAGAGGAALALVKWLGEHMEAKGIKASFARGGTTSIMVDMLRKGLIGTILEGQSFDKATVESLRDNPRHVETNPWTSYNYHAKGCFANLVDIGFLGCTEIDLSFNVNVNTHSDGWLLHGIGGHTDVAAGAGITMIIAPLFRKRFPIVVERCHTVTCPGETVDVLVTERGVAINPARQDLMDLMRGTTFPLRTIEELHDVAIGYTGKPLKPEHEERVVALVEYRDGTIIDVVRQIRGQDRAGQI